MNIIESIRGIFHKPEVNLGAVDRCFKDMRKHGVCLV